MDIEFYAIFGGRGAMAFYRETLLQRRAPIVGNEPKDTPKAPEIKPHKPRGAKSQVSAAASGVIKLTDVAPKSRPVTPKKPVTKKARQAPATVSPATGKRKCEVCGKPVTGRRKDTCSDKCGSTLRQRRSRAARKGKGRR